MIVNFRLDFPRQIAERLTGVKKVPGSVAGSIPVEAQKFSENFS